MRAAFVRYLAVGAAATGLHWSVLLGAVEALHVAAWLGSGIGAVAGAQLAFFANRRFTFGHRGPVGPAWRRFMGTAAAGALLGMAIVAAGTAAGLHYLLAQALATATVVVLTFAVNRRWSFGG